MGLYDPLIRPASTMSPGHVQTTSVTTDVIELKDQTIENVSHDFSETSVKQVPSSKALYEAYHILNDYITSIDPHHILYTDNTVITLPLLPEAFTKPDWDTYFNWVIDNGKIVYSSNNISNYIKIVPEVFTHPGYYFLVIEVDRLDSGELVVMDTITDDDAYVLASIEDTGIHYVEVKISNNAEEIELDNPISPYAATATDAHTIIFEARNVFNKQAISIKSIGVYRVTDRIRHYLTYYLQNNDNLEEFKKEIREVVNELSLNLVNTDLLANETKSILDTHLKDKYAHKDVLTLGNLGAASADHEHHYKDGKLKGVAPEEHTHLPSECGAAAKVHTHSNYLDIDDAYTKIVEVVKSLDSDSANVADHLSSIGDDKLVVRGNPHGTTAALVGAAEKDHNHDDRYIDINTVNAKISESVIEAKENLELQISNHIKEPNPHDITPSKIGAAPTIHEHDYTTRDDVNHLINEAVGGIEVGTTGGSSSTAPMVMAQYTQGKFPDGDIKPSSLITRPITPVIFSRIMHQYDNYDYFSGIARSNRAGYNKTKAYYAFSSLITSPFIVSGAVSATNPIYIEYDFHHRRQVIGYTLQADLSVSGRTSYPLTYELYCDNKLIHTQTAASYSSSSNVYSYYFRLPQLISLSRTITPDTTDPDPRFSLTSDDVKLNDYIELKTKTISQSGTDEEITYFRVSNINSLNTASGYTAIEQTALPEEYNYNLRTLSFRILTVKTVSGSTNYTPIKIIPLFKDAVDNEIAIKRGLTYMYKSRRTVTESAAKLDLTPYLESKITPLYLFLQTTTKTLEGKKENQQVNKLIADQFPYEFGYSKEGLPLFMDIFDNATTSDTFGTITVTPAATNSATAKNIYNSTDTPSYIANGKTLTFTHKLAEITPTKTVKSTLGTDGILIDGRFALTSANTKLGDYILNEITVTSESDGVTTTTIEYAMYEVIDINNLNNTDGYKQVEDFHKESSITLHSVQFLFDSAIKSNIPSTIKLTAKVKSIDTHELNIKVGSTPIGVNTSVVEYHTVDILDIQNYVPIANGDGDVWFTPIISETSSIVELVLTLTTTAANVGITKFIPYIATRSYSISTDTTTNDDFEFPLGRLDYTEVNGTPMYKHTGNVLGNNVTMPLIGRGTTSSDVTTYNIDNPYGSDLVECKLIDYKGNNTHSMETAVVSTNITSDKIVVKVAHAPTKYHCLNIRRLW